MGAITRRLHFYTALGKGIQQIIDEGFAELRNTHDIWTSLPRENQHRIQVARRRAARRNAPPPTTLINTIINQGSSVPPSARIAQANAELFGFALNYTPVEEETTREFIAPIRTTETPPSYSPEPSGDEEDRLEEALALIGHTEVQPAPATTPEIAQDGESTSTYNEVCHFSMFRTQL